MYQLIYVSSAVTPFSDEELKSLLVNCRSRNTSIEVTGLLLYKDGNFMQLLEGEREVLETLYTKISRDPRHRGLIVLIRQTIAERSFPNWSMGFRDLRNKEVQSLPGYNQFMNTSLDSPTLSAPSQAERLFAVFKGDRI